jgi:hypothetical protein
MYSKCAILKSTDTLTAPRKILLAPNVWHIAEVAAFQHFINASDGAKIHKYLSREFLCLPRLMRKKHKSKELFNLKHKKKINNLNS